MEKEEIVVLIDFLVEIAFINVSGKDFLNQCSSEFNFTFKNVSNRMIS